MTPHDTSGPGRRRASPELTNSRPELLDVSRRWQRRKIDELTAT
ncbi:hypothetical protein [Amycolatopsis sp. NPDC051372]